MMIGGGERWVLDELPAELSEQAYMWQWEHGMDGDSNRRREWQCSGRKPGAAEAQLGTMNWVGSMWEQEADEEDFVEGAEQQLFGGRSQWYEG